MASTSPQKAADGPQPAATSLTVTDASDLFSSFTNFLTLALHSLLYHRGLYPPNTFLTARAYNLPVQQSRHPGLCAWINDAIAAVAAQLQRKCVKRVAIVIHAPKTLAVLERWIFDVSSFPEWGSGAASGGTTADAPANEDEDVLDEDIVEDVESSAVNWVDVDEAMRGALRRIAYAAESLPNAPTGSTFTLAVELRDDAPAPIRHPRPWIPSPPNLQPRSKAQPKRGASWQAATTTPVRSVRAGPLFFECWIEQAGTTSRDSQTPSNKTSNTTSS